MTKEEAIRYLRNIPITLIYRECELQKYVIAINMAVTALENLGYWTILDKCSNSDHYCPKCHKKVIKEGWSTTVKKINFCPNCGAKMPSPQESEEV